MRGHRVSALVNRTRQETFDSEEQEGTVSRQDEGEGTKRELRADATRSGPGSPARPRPPVPLPPLPARSLYDEKAREVSAGHRESPRGAAGALQDAGAVGGAGGRTALGAPTRDPDGIVIPPAFRPSARRLASAAAFVTATGRGHGP